LRHTIAVRRPSRIGGRLATVFKFTTYYESLTITKQKKVPLLLLLNALAYLLLLGGHGG
jgi:hypothetical protein